MNQNDRHENGLLTEEQTHATQTATLPDITPYAMTFIQHKAKQLVGKCGIREHDREDIEQELYLDLWQRLDKFDGDKATYNTFVQRVVENKISDLLRERCSDKSRLERLHLSFSRVVQLDEANGCTITLGNTIYNEQANRNRIRTCQEEQDHAIDVRLIISRLPDYLQKSCELLLEGHTTAEVARMMGMKRVCFYEQVIEPLREIFREADLENFF
ncbi:MAG: sigma factor [Planctomycetia bacterium]|jgi:RNA polymerase sigma factor (sigma-70 family)